MYFGDEIPFNEHLIGSAGMVVLVKGALTTCKYSLDSPGPAQVRRIHDHVLEAHPHSH
jgi:hypothetical protein